MSLPTVLVLGANGRLGRAAVQAFAAAGWHVRAQMRRAPAAPLPAGAIAVNAALADTAAMAAAAGAARVVVHAVNPPYTRWAAEALPALHQALALAEGLGALFMLPGNVYNFGAQMPPLLRPETAQRPANALGAIRCAMEAEMQARAAAAPALRCVVIRAGDFYGAGIGSWFDQAIVKRLAQGRLVYPGPLDVPHAWAYLPDLARAFVAVAAQPVTPATPAFRGLHFAGHTLTGAALLDGLQAAAARLGLQPARGWHVGGLPWGLIRAAGTVYPPWRELARMRYLWQVPHALDGSALEAATGPLPVTPVSDALRQTLQALGLRPGTAAPALSSRA